MHVGFGHWPRDQVPDFTVDAGSRQVLRGKFFTLEESRRQYRWSGHRSGLKPIRRTKVSAAASTGMSTPTSLYYQQPAPTLSDFTKLYPRDTGQKMPPPSL